MRVWTNLCYRESFSVTNCWQELRFEFSRQNYNRNVQSPSVWWLVMTHHTAKANLEKGSSWPPEAIPYGLVLSVALYYPNAPTPHLRPNPRPTILHISPYQSIIK